MTDVVVQSGPIINVQVDGGEPINVELTSVEVTPEDPRVGDIDNLTTEDKSSIVGAINELNYEDVSLALLYNNAKAG